MPCLKCHDLIGAKIQLKSLNTKAERKCLEEGKCNEIKLRNGKSIAGKKIFPSLKFD